MFEKRALETNFWLMFMFDDPPYNISTVDFLCTNDAHLRDRDGLRQAIASGVRMCQGAFFLEKKEGEF